MSLADDAVWRRRGDRAVSFDGPGVSPFVAGDLVRLDESSEGWDHIGLGRLKRLRATVVEPGPAPHQDGSEPFFNEDSAFILFDGEAEPRWVWWLDLRAVDPIELLASLG
jgi:hypothetical protein